MGNVVPRVASPRSRSRSCGSIPDFRMAPAEDEASDRLPCAHVSQLVERPFDPPRLLLLRRLEGDDRPREIWPPRRPRKEEKRGEIGGHKRTDRYTAAHRV